MIVFNKSNELISYLDKGYLLAKVTKNYKGMTKQCLVAGTLMVHSENDWWYILVKREDSEVYSIIKKNLFLELLREYYIDLKIQTSKNESYYSINRVCDIHESSRYIRKINCWKETESDPTELKQNNKVILGNEHITRRST